MNKMAIMHVRREKLGGGGALNIAMMVLAS